MVFPTLGIIQKTSIVACVENENAVPLQGEEYRQSLMNYRSDLLTVTKESQTSYDKTVITVCSGAIVATIGLFEKLPTNTPTIGILFAWIFWSVGIISITVSFYAATKAANETLRRLDKYLEAKRVRAFRSKDGRWNKAIAWGNLLGFVFLVSGILSFSTSLGYGVLIKKNPVYERTTESEKRNQGIIDTTTASQGADGTNRKRSPDSTSSAEADPAKEVIKAPILPDPSSSETPHPLE